MAKKRKKTEKTTLESWLLTFEQHVGKGVVVSLLVENGKFSFVSCVDRKRYLSDDKEDDEEAGIRLKSGKQLPMLKVAQDYIQ